MEQLINIESTLQAVLNICSLYHTPVNPMYTLTKRWFSMLQARWWNTVDSTLNWIHSRPMLSEIYVQITTWIIRCWITHWINVDLAHTVAISITTTSNGWINLDHSTLIKSCQYQHRINVDHSTLITCCQYQHRIYISKLKEWCNFFNLKKWSLS